MIRIFIGDDSRMPVAFHVLSHSIHTRSSQSVSITPLSLSQLKDIYKRERDPLQSTDFSFSRFLTPYLSDYQGWSLFMDNDMLVLDDIAKLWDLRDERYAVMVVKHEHRPKKSVKFLDSVQTIYEKKNWSSLMLFNNEKCRALTPDYVNNASGLDLHQFRWLYSDKLIGDLPKRWNHLVGYDSSSLDVANAHYTSGGPYFSENIECDYFLDWIDERKAMLYCKKFKMPFVSPLID